MFGYGPLERLLNSIGDLSIGDWYLTIGFMKFNLLSLLGEVRFIAIVRRHCPLMLPHMGEVHLLFLVNKTALIEFVGLLTVY